MLSSFELEHILWHVYETEKIFGEHWHLDRIRWWISQELKEKKEEEKKLAKWSDEQDGYIYGQQHDGWWQDDAGVWYPPKDEWKDHYPE